MSTPEYTLFDEAKVLADDRPSEEGNLLEWALDAEHMIRRLVKAFNSTPQPAQRTWVGLPKSAFTGMTLQQAIAMQYAEQVLKDENT